MINPMIPSQQPGAARAVGLGAHARSAQTRFNNSRVDAKNSNLSAAAQIPKQQNRRASVRQVVSPSQGPVGYSQGSVMPNPAPNPNQGQVVGGLVGQGTGSPDVFSEDLAIEYFMSSPEVQEALAKEKLKQYFKQNNPAGAEATVARDVLQSVVSRVS